MTPKGDPSLLGSTTQVDRRQCVTDMRQVRSIEHCNTRCIDWFKANETTQSAKPSEELIQTNVWIFFVILKVDIYLSRVPVVLLDLRKGRKAQNTAASSLSLSLLAARENRAHLALTASKFLHSERFKSY